MGRDTSSLVARGAHQQVLVKLIELAPPQATQRGVGTSLRGVHEVVPGKRTISSRIRVRRGSYADKNNAMT